jgi:hypothetical protein
MVCFSLSSLKFSLLCYKLFHLDEKYCYAIMLPFPPPLFVEIILEQSVFRIWRRNVALLYKSRAQLPENRLFSSYTIFLRYFSQTFLYALSSARLIPTFDTFLTRVRGQARNPRRFLALSARGSCAGGRLPKMLKSYSCQVLRYNAARKEDALSCYASHAVAQPPSPFIRW